MKKLDEAQPQPEIEEKTDFDRLMEQPIKRDNSLTLLFDDDSFNKAWRIAQVMADMRGIPSFLQKSPADCLAVVLQAHRWNMDPVAVALKTYQVKSGGLIAYEAQLVMAAVMNSGAIVGGFKFEWQGEGQGTSCRAGAIERGNTEITWGPWITATQITTQNSPNWKQNPAQQLAYYQARAWSRIYAPGAILGVYSDDEFEQPSVSARPANNSVVQSNAPIFADIKPYPDEQFAKNAQAWQILITSGKKTIEGISAMLKTKGFTLTDEQLEVMQGWGKEEPETVIEGELADE